MSENAPADRSCHLLVVRYRPSVSTTHSEVPEEVWAVTPPGQARMLGAWTDSDLMGCWADVYDDDHGEMQACEANPDPKSALGLCSEQDRQLAMAASVGRPLSLMRQKPGGGPSFWQAESAPRSRS